MKRLRHLNISQSDRNTFNSIVMDTFDTVCRMKVRVGGRYMSSWHAMDGQKYVCMDDLMIDVENQECVVYSFGISDDWSFEDKMAKLGCKVYAYDPTINIPNFGSLNIKFEKMGLSGEAREGKSKTFSQILDANNHTNTKISYLKMDIEGAEIDGLPVWLESGSFANVQQIAIEYHLDSHWAPSLPIDIKTKKLLTALRDLQITGGFRMMNWEANLCWEKMGGKSGPYYDLAEIVLIKSSSQTECFSF